MEHELGWFIQNHDDICDVFGLSYLAIVQWEGDSEFGFEFRFKIPHELTKVDDGWMIDTYKTEDVSLFMEECKRNREWGPINLNPKPNNRCPCLSGRKFKRCCGRYL